MQCHVFSHCFYHFKQGARQVFVSLGYFAYILGAWKGFIVATPLNFRLNYECCKLRSTSERMDWKQNKQNEREDCLEDSGQMFCSIHTPSFGNNGSTFVVITSWKIGIYTFISTIELRDLLQPED